MSSAKLVYEWRGRMREELIGQRMSIPAERREQANEAITRTVLTAFPLLASMTIGFYWPYKGAVDARYAIRHFRRQGAVVALPRVVRKAQPLQFNEWWPGAPMQRGVFDIPFPDNARVVKPQELLSAPVGFDVCGYRLGYGGGYYDRTLAAMPVEPLKIALAFETSRMGTINPQPHDVPMDFIVTERGVYQVGVNRIDLVENLKMVQGRARQIVADRLAAAARGDAVQAA